MDHRVKSGSPWPFSTKGKPNQKPSKHPLKMTAADLQKPTQKLKEEDPTADHPATGTNPKKKAKPVRRRRLTKASIMRRRTTFCKLPRELRQDILWKVVEDSDLTAKPDHFSSFFVLNEKNMEFEKWAKKVKSLKKGVDVDMEYVIKKWRDVHMELNPQWEEEVRAYREWLNPKEKKWLW
ncbi:hypothetical protein FKW77_009512 [Venturia effusa]|uniref:Uncharacterized protein n=1 Tax=Venturia effusa TaxID=50376 RepID=A0A517L039_9PEZI|nr:hypothetical protein FKW77_009512 [Venturia effusa]